MVEQKRGSDASLLLHEFEDFEEFRMRLGIDVKISKNSDICFAQIPKKLDPELLLNQTINLDTNTKLRLKSKKYTCIVNQVESEPSLILSKKLRRLQPVSVLKFKRANKKGQDEDVPEQDSNVELHKFDSRHPFFGHDCEMDVTVNDDVSQKLEQACSVKKRKLKKKKNSKKNEEHDDTKEKDELIYQMLQNSQVIKKESSLEDSSTTKMKKVNGHINSTIVSGAQLPDFDPDISEITNSQGFNKKVKKEKSGSKKRKHETSDQESIISDILNSVKIELNETSHRQKKKRKHSE